jgi:rhodanese-related sulfurtransferase
MGKQLVYIFLLTLIIAFGVNQIRSDSIPLIGEWRDLQTGEGPIVPPSAQEGDPKFISIDDAVGEFGRGRAHFVDARNPDEFECGTIPHSINVPFDSLPVSGVDKFIDSCLGGMAKDAYIVVFCSGEECDLSLHLARNMQQYGYKNLQIFFGGAREWEKFEMPIEKRRECGS